MHRNSLRQESLAFCARRLLTPKGAGFLLKWRSCFGTPARYSTVDVNAKGFDPTGVDRGTQASSSTAPSRRMPGSSEKPRMPRLAALRRAHRTVRCRRLGSLSASRMARLAVGPRPGESSHPAVDQSTRAGSLRSCCTDRRSGPSAILSRSADCRPPA